MFMFALLLFASCSGTKPERRLNISPAEFAAAKRRLLGLSA